LARRESRSAPPRWNGSCFSAQLRLRLAGVFGVLANEGLVTVVSSPHASGTGDTKLFSWGKPPRRGAIDMGRGGFGWAVLVTIGRSLVRRFQRSRRAGTVRSSGVLFTAQHA